ncbi:2OG-Fe(II) oxygenase family protein [Candidatus Synchoanobacter obligatus]|uniref:2-oxoglutarate-dependent ethylene/succinate-forming enzyme n=1 Tax=Candidatus Synchoanobacter obligatus TaxID=2919597 RepID=A0ABT1L5C7_9GAMM|nr:2OG-Fe(II) oxygenase family protein [Candidatus Synchoanobacter obligatus]MCP8352068.1 isopenicillin N synthase family oxygenase [Candidatus Synchoanobacter obligatus]
MSGKILVVDYQSPSAGKDLVQSLTHTGFAILKSVPVEQVLIDEVYTHWKAFFHSNQKFHYPFNPTTMDGFASTAVSEVAKGYDKKDLKEFFHYLEAGRCPDGLRGITSKFVQQLNPIAQQLLQWIENGLPADILNGLSEPLTGMITGSNNSKLRLIHYPPLTGDEPEGALRAAAHEDINLITLLPAATAEGLQVLSAECAWLDVGSDPGSIIINAGDMLAECTNGFIKSTTHRVVNPVGAAAREGRMSMPFFVHPRSEVRLSSRHTAQSYREERYNENGLVTNKMTVS